MRPRTRHLNCMLHHFKGEVANGRLVPKAISTIEQQADILTKALAVLTFERLRKLILGWYQVHQKGEVRECGIPTNMMSQTRSLYGRTLFGRINDGTSQMGSAYQILHISYWTYQDPSPDSAA